MSTTEFTDTTQMPFGKFQGKKMADVPAVYLLWLHDNDCHHPGVKKYILDNLQGLKQEVKNIRK
jgi:uncharacterized protein (DUF3820 family)